MARGELPHLPPPTESIDHTHQHPRPSSKRISTTKPVARQDEPITRRKLVTPTNGDSGNVTKTRGDSYDILVVDEKYAVLV